MRSKPAFKLDSSRNPYKETEPLGCLWMLFVAVGGYFIFKAIDRVFSGSGDRLDHMICYGVLIGLVLLAILAKLQGDQDKKKLREEKQEWKRKCRSVEVAIVNRYNYPGGRWEDEYGVSHYSRPTYQLNLELTAEQRALFPNLQSVSTAVNGNIYSNLIDRNFVRVYYQPDSPMTFLLEAELE